MSQLPCIVLAGGLGTRLRSALPDVPKCLAPVGDSTFLELQLDGLAARGVTHFVLSLGHLSQMVIEAIEPMRDRLHIEHVVEPDRLGTGGAALLAMETFGFQSALLTNGDTYLDGGIGPILAPLGTVLTGEIARLAMINVPDRGRYGGVRVDGGIVKEFTPKGLSGAGLINAGLYQLDRQVFHGRSVGTYFSLENDVLPAVAEAGRLGATQLQGYFIDIGIPQDYKKFVGSRLDK